MTPTSVVAFFCEDIRTEQEGRFTLIGIYPDNISISDPPQPLPEGHIKALPKMCVFARISFDAKRDIGPITTKMINPDGSQTELGSADAKAVETAKTSSAEQKSPIAGVNMILQTSPFMVPTPGRFQFEITVGKEKFIAGTLNIIFASSKA